LAVARPLEILDPQVGSIERPLLPQSAYDRGDTRLRYRVVGGNRHQRDDAPPAAALQRARREGPSRRTADERHELAAFQCPKSPVLPTENSTLPYGRRRLLCGLKATKFPTSRASFGSHRTTTASGL